MASADRGPGADIYLLEQLLEPEGRASLSW